MDAQVLVGVPSGSDWKANFGMSLVTLIAHSANMTIDGDDNIQLAIDNPKGSILSRSRKMITDRALKMNASHVLFVDSDMTFPPHMLESLLRRKQRVVACNCAVKQVPSNPTARNSHPDKPHGVPVYTGPESTGIEKVWRIGTGVMLIETDVLLELEYPYWDIVWKEEVQDYQGEDWSFCEKLEQAGIDIYIDHDMSKQIGHIGTYTYTHAVVDIPAGIVDSAGKVIETPDKKEE